MTNICENCIATNMCKDVMGSCEENVITIEIKIARADAHAILNIYNYIVVQFV